MEIVELVTPQRVLAALHAGDKPQLLRELSARAAKQVAISEDVILGALTSREMLGSTGIGRGVALPHARIVGLDRFYGLFARLEYPLSFDAIDGGPVDLVFLLLLPEQPGRDHLSALACISRPLRDPEIAGRLRGAKSASELYELLTRASHSQAIGVPANG